ncbi:RAB6-interacting golgin-like isoform X1 [Xenopus laevis]|uniref:RAB6-interacting golgin n=1 Tax=Xenopus laevis TaxID=8355 RepID=A0A8J1KMR7_XENLA|nr:RAB6-interacting golgin-like isoform X1 [Xenopus laevis]
MSGWQGFSEEELRNLKMKQELPHQPDHSRRQPTSAKPAAAKSRRQMQRKMALQAQSQQLAKQNGSLSVPPEQQLSRPTSSSSPNVISCPVEKKQIIHGQPQMSTSVSSGTDHKEEDLCSEENEELNKKEMELREKSRLDQLQLEQRLMEEKNKRKKALLAKAIAERSKKTQAEVVKLKRIQTQLQALDDLVSTDIGILRNCIDQACIEFSQAKKRYDKAEAEYILAKVDLHKKTEIKEQLTEHLCTIIQQNELRKAKKLEELMQQLEVDADEEKLELEIEVEQMLQQQETEAKRQLVATQQTQVQVDSPTEKNVEPPEKEKSAEKEASSDQNGPCQSSPHLTNESCVQDKSTAKSEPNSLSDKQPV